MNTVTIIGLLAIVCMMIALNIFVFIKMQDVSFLLRWGYRLFVLLVSGGFTFAILGSDWDPWQT